MKSFLFLFLIILSFSQKLAAQKVIYSDYAPYDLRSSSLSIVGKVNGLLYTFRSYGKDFFLEAYDDEMQKKATVVLDFFPAKIYNVRFIPDADKIIVLYQAQSGTKITQYAALLNEKGILQKNPIKIDEQRTSFFGTVDKEYFSMAVSQNKQELIVYGLNKKNKKIDFTGYWVELPQMRLSKRVKFSYKGHNTLATGDGLLSDSGQFFLPVYTVIGSRNYSDEYALLSLRKGEPGMKVLRMDLGNKYLEYPFQKIDQSRGKIYFASFYSSQKNGNNEGVFASSMDLGSTKFDTHKILPFDDAMRGEASEKRRAKALNEFKINQLIVKADGGFLLAAEEQYVTTQNNFMPRMGFYSFYYTPMMAQSIREYHYNDILLVSYNAQQEKEWHGFLRKEQYSQEDAGMFSSYCLLNTGGSLGFLFNDFNARRSRIQLSSVAPDGRLQTGYLDAGGTDDPDWLPRIGKQVEAREIIVPCLRKKQLCFAKIVL